MCLQSCELLRLGSFPDPGQTSSRTIQLLIPPKAPKHFGLVFSIPSGLKNLLGSICRVLSELLFRYTNEGKELY